MTVQRIEIESLVPGHRLQKTLREARDYLGVELDAMEEIRFYLVEADSCDVARLADEIFADPVIQRCVLQHDAAGRPGGDPSWVLEVTFRPGVTDNPAHAAREAMALVGVSAEVASGTMYYLFGSLDEAHAHRIGAELLANELIQRVDVMSFTEFTHRDRFADVTLPRVELAGVPGVQTIALDLDDEALVQLSEKNCLALSLDEMRHIRDHYQSVETSRTRQSLGLPVWPTDVELEVIAQSWSEHCKHKIFSATIEYSEDIHVPDSPRLDATTIRSLYRTYIKGATQAIRRDRGIDWLISVFSDNAGIVRFDDTLDLCIKVETHNSPSALDPYGGALTGILGVNRDILGCGLGARPIANTDVFCFAPPDLASTDERELMPDGLMPPRRIFDGVHLGVEDGGNKSGIPTINGAIYFDRDFAGKPLVFVGTIGAMPQVLSGDRPSSVKTAKPGDRIVMAGGAIGADGIHGATFSSLELSQSSPATAVQIGDPLTQKRLADFLLEARDQGLFSAVTDNGAGGLSSSVGEMATATGGAELDLARCPVKYPGLQPWELMVSESQERMTFAVPPEHLDELLALAHNRGVIATDIGSFNSSGSLSVHYKSQLVGSLDLQFLHDSLPPMQLQAVWKGPQPRKPWCPGREFTETRSTIPDAADGEFITGALLRILAAPNVVSKEPWVRRYDHEVQGATHVKPFVGRHADGPGDSGVIWLYPHGGDRQNGVAIGCGLAPRLSLHDTYLMAQFAVDEAVRNVVAVGGDIDQCCLLDNFCWPDPVCSPRNPDGDQKLAQLVRACRGLYDICADFGTPLVSGKDSMKNDYRGRNRIGDDIAISILPTLLITAMSKVTIGATATSDFRSADDLIYLIGPRSAGLYGSEFAEWYQIPRELDCPPTIDPPANALLYRAVHRAITDRLIASCHDVSDGGLLACLAECMIGGRLGASVDLARDSLIDGPFELIDLLFNESPGRFVVSIPPRHQSRFEDLLCEHGCLLLGQCTSEPHLSIRTSMATIPININLEDLVQAWKTSI